LTLVSGVNIAVWFLLYHQFSRRAALAARPASGSAAALRGAYVFGTARPLVLPRADVQRICLFDTWLSSVRRRPLGRDRAEIAFAAQWAIMSPSARNHDWRGTPP